MDTSAHVQAEEQGGLTTDILLTLGTERLRRGQYMARETGGEMTER
jgi:hypothetical protein